MRIFRFLTAAGLLIISLTVIGAAQTAERVYRVGEEGVTAPKLVSRTQPAYTEEARANRVQGTVELSVQVDAAGLPQNIEVVRGIDAGLDESAVSAVQQWRFEPAQKDGTPVRVAATIEINFRLD